MAFARCVSLSSLLFVVACSVPTWVFSLRLVRVFVCVRVCARLCVCVCVCVCSVLSFVRITQFVVSRTPRVAGRHAFAHVVLMRSVVVALIVVAFIAVL